MWFLSFLSQIEWYHISPPLIPPKRGGKRIKGIGRFLSVFLESAHRGAQENKTRISNALPAFSLTGKISR